MHVEGKAYSWRYSVLQTHFLVIIPINEIVYSNAKSREPEVFGPTSPKKQCGSRSDSVERGVGSGLILPFNQQMFDTVIGNYRDLLKYREY